MRAISNQNSLQLHRARGADEANTTARASFWRFWTIRVAWLVALLALVAWAMGDDPLADPASALERVMASPLVWAIGIAFLVQLALLGAAQLRRVPPFHALLSTLIEAALLSAALVLWPAQSLPFLLLGLVPFLDLARWQGWVALILLPIFPLAALAYDVTQQAGTLPEIPLVGAWLGVVGLGVAVAQARLAPGQEARRSKQEAPVESVLVATAQQLVRDSRYARILDVLVRQGVEILDGPGQRAQARAIALTFKPGLRDELTVAALSNMDRNSLPDSFLMQGVLGTLMTEGEPIDTDGSQPPFTEIRPLAGTRVLLFPLTAGRDIYGAALFATKNEARIEDEGVQRTLIALVQQVSLALHNAALQQELRRDNDQRLKSEEEARHQLARDLHDGPVQRVAAISMQLEFIKALMKRQPERAIDEVEQLQQVAKQASQEMRTMLFSLRPVVLESEGLTAALQEFVDRLRKQDKLNIAFQSDPLPRLDPTVEEVAFAILQEAIGNAKKYAGGAPIHVRLIKGPTMVVGQVEDEGPGFDLEAVTASYGTRASLGMLNMKERAAMAGGQLRIDTAPGKGTVVSISVPYVQE